MWKPPGFQSEGCQRSWASALGREVPHPPPDGTKKQGSFAAQKGASTSIVFTPSILLASLAIFYLVPTGSSARINALIPSAPVNRRHSRPPSRSRSM